MSFLSEEINDIVDYSEANVPTPHDQEDVSSIDMLSEAVETIMDDVRNGLGLKDGDLQDRE
ncbi:MAG: hypothetical protein K0Q73_7087 [Paenibacillus sp.]|nr:hypothetical protein [Paenibacillus sp.]